MVAVNVEPSGAPGPSTWRASSLPSGRVRTNRVGSPGSAPATSRRSETLGVSSASCTVTVIGNWAPAGTSMRKRWLRVVLAEVAVVYQSPPVGSTLGPAVRKEHCAAGTVRARAGRGSPRTSNSASGE
jgi:hypothetical protein